MVSGLKKIIEKSFISVFDDLNIKTEIWFEKTKLLTTGKSDFSDYIIENIATFPVFGVNAISSVVDSYVELQISSEINREIYKPINIIERNLKKRKDKPIKNGMLPINAIEHNEREGFALLGNPGSGKTTVFKYIALFASQGNKIRGKIRIPIFLPVRNITLRDETILESCARFLENIGIGHSDKVIMSLLENGKLLLLLDGLDETSERKQQNILLEIKDLREKYKRNIFCISARPYSLSSGLNGFQKWETLELNLISRTQFINKWFDSVSPEKKEGILLTIKNNPHIIDIGSNPLLLSIICALYYNDLNIPKNIDELYGRCLDGMLGGWDSFRNIARNTLLSNVSITQRKVLVSYLAAYLFQNNKIVFSADDLKQYNIIADAVKALRIEPLDPDDLLQSLYNDFGLIVEQSPGLYSFSHLTLHEYLTALYVVDQRRENELLSNYRHNEEWNVVIKLVARMLPNSDEYIRYLTNSTKFTSIDDVNFIKSFWDMEPICSETVSKRFALTVLQSILSSTKFYPNAEYIINDDTLFIQIDKKMKLRKIKKNQEIDLNIYAYRKNHPMYILSTTLPTLLDILYKIGYDFDELVDNTNNKLIDTLKNHEYPTIKTVNFKYIVIAKPRYRKNNNKNNN